MRVETASGDRFILRVEHMKELLPTITKDDSEMPATLFEGSHTPLKGIVRERRVSDEQRMINRDQRNRNGPPKQQRHKMAL